MLKLIIGNRAYSSWSLRGWLACKQSALPFETVLIPMDTSEWVDGSAKRLLPSGKVPTLWDGDVVVWDSLAIIDWLADHVRTARISRGHFWPHDPAARAFARSICAEMHSGYAALRAGCSMNLKRDYPDYVPTPAVAADVARIDALWTEARTRFHSIDEAHEGPFLFGTLSAADIMFAPVVTRFKTYRITLSDTSAAYVEAMLAHPWMVEWTEAARAETYPFNRDYFEPHGGIDGGLPAR